MNMNLVILGGNITRDPEMDTLPSGAAIAKFGMAINRKWKSSDGQPKEEVCFVDLTAFGKTADLIGQYVHKGDPLLVQGRLKFDQWESKEGGKRSKLHVIVDSMQFVGGKRDGGGSKRDDSGDNSQPPLDDDYAPF